mgnify:FL=1
MRSGELGEDVPAYLAYRIGGANSIRGFAVEDLGAELFGKNQLLGTVEYRYLLRPIQPVRVFSWSLRLGLQAAVFADFGGAWSLGREFAWDRFKSGVGAVLRVLVPGSEMLRLDVGISEDGDAAVYVRGLSKFDAQRKRLR